MTKTRDAMRWSSAWLAGCVLLFAGASLSAQELDPALGVQAVAVLEDGRIALRNGERSLDCALVTDGDGVRLGDCRAGGAAVTLLTALSDDDWQALVRDRLQDEGCRLSAFGAVAEVVAFAAEANGVEADTIDRARVALAARAEAAVSQMLRDGRLTYRGGELALDACP